MTQVPPQVIELIQRFDRNRDAYKSPHYNETQLRREFLDPLFKALGWDIDNEQGYAEAYKDVVHEDAIKVGEATKAPDYSFRIGGTRKFFVEAKRPSVDVKNDASPAYQLRRYAWTTKLSLSILSDFEEFAVYDCRLKPDHKQSAAIGRILHIPYTDYATRWEEIAGIFSRDAVLKGSFDRFADSNRAKGGTADVDDEFLQTIETWRSDLARNLALRNLKLSQRELNFAVQRTIDRIIFLRICEGRGIEDYGRLRALINGDRIYPRLCQIFEEADTRYNSGLFHFKPEKDRHEAPDELTLEIDIDDKLLREIIRSLYYPDSPYVFSALPADILGQVYEQFLGKVIRLTESHHAVVEEKPEVKKAGGVYYTPTNVVDYIVHTTAGQLLEGKTPKQAAKLKVLDPACGSGSFLIGAYEYLLKWQRTEILKASPQSAPLIKPFLGGQDIRRYLIEDDERHLIVIPSGWTRQQMAKAKRNASEFSEREAWNFFSRSQPAIATHLSNFTEPLRKRQDKGDYWWELRPCDYYHHFDAPKVIFPDICKAPRFYLDRSGIYLANTAYCLATGDLYLLGILNSRLFWFAISNISIPFGIRAGQYRYRLIYQYMEQVPIRLVRPDNATDKARHDEIAQLAEQMLGLHRRHSAARTPQEQTALERQIAATDTQLDTLIYAFYGLTDTEIKIVEASVGSLS